MTKAYLVWDGGADVNIPPPLGVPCEDQLIGTVGEQLIELATRSCYDSLGLHPTTGKRKGRSTPKTLKNVLQVKHLSVLEHYALTIEMRAPLKGAAATLLAFINRPGTWLRSIMKDGELTFRITANLRSVIEWEMWSSRLANDHCLNPEGDTYWTWVTLGDTLTRLWSREVPILLGMPTNERDAHIPWMRDCEALIVEPETDTERHITLYLRGSRGFSHEQVRHRFAISQRSTRYCEEGESPWHWHPLLDSFLKDSPHGRDSMTPEAYGLEAELRGAESTAQNAYKKIIETLEPWLLSKLAEDAPYRKKHARKQARGAARGFLGNALETQMFFTAPVWAWKHIANMRAAEAADAEIRVVISEAVEQLKLSRYADSFESLELVEAQDGMGLCLGDGGHA